MSIDLNESGIQAAIKTAVEEATSGLISKRDELLAEVKKLRKNQEIKPEQLEALENELDTYKTKWAEAEKLAKTNAQEADKVKKLYEAESGYTNNLLVENGLNEALVKEGIAKQFLPAVKSMLKSQVQVKIEGNERKAVIGDKLLSDFVSEWSKGDEGKHFIAAPANSGGGSNGGGDAKGAGKTMPRAQFDKISSAEKVAFLNDGGKPID
jgi:alanyl-tRNA synthetase